MNNVKYNIQKLIYVIVNDQCSETYEASYNRKPLKESLISFPGDYLQSTLWTIATNKLKWEINLQVKGVQYYKTKPS